MYFFYLKQFVDPALMQYFIPDRLFAYLAGEWLVVIVNAMRSLYFFGLASDPVLQALEMYAFDAASASTNTEQRVSFGGTAIEAKTAEGLVT